MEKHCGIAVLIQESPYIVVLEQPAQQVSLLNCGLLRSLPTLLFLFIPGVLSSTHNVVTPQIGIPLYEHQRCPSQLLPSSPRGSQFIFLSVSAGDILFQHERAYWSQNLSSNICFIFCLKQRPALTNLSLLSSLAWSSESHSLTSTDPSVICPLISFSIFFTSAKWKDTLIFHLSVYSFSTVFFPPLSFLSLCRCLSMFKVGLVTCRSHLSSPWCATAHAIQC